MLCVDSQGSAKQNRLGTILQMPEQKPSASAQGSVHQLRRAQKYL